MQLEIDIRNVYGNPTAYPINEAAKSVARIAGTKTLTRYALAEAMNMGMTVIVIGASPRAYSKPTASAFPVVA